jgi:hypothetical protein
MSAPKNIKLANVAPVLPLYLRQKDALKYLGIEEVLFRKLRKEFDLSEYGYGNMKWYKLAELNKMMEEDLLIKKQAS